MSDLKVNEVKTDTIKDQTGTSALTVDTSGYLTASQPVLAHLTMTSNQTDVTEQTWTKLQLDLAVIDTKSGFNNSNDTYVIPVAGYYRIYVQASIGVLGEAGSIRDSGICITRTRSSTETQLAFSHHRLRDGGNTDVDDVMEQAYVVDQCQAGDIIKFYVYVNTVTGTAYDVIADVDSGNENAHLNTGLPGSGSGEGRITYAIIERII